MPRFIAGFFMPVRLPSHVPVLFHKYQYKKSRRIATESVLHIPWYDWSLKNTCSGAAAVEVYSGFLIS